MRVEYASEMVLVKFQVLSNFLNKKKGFNNEVKWQDILHIDLKGIFKLTGVAHLPNRPCKDDSHVCMTISTKSCITQILADVCKRTCGLCNDNQLPLPPQQPPLPTPPQLPLPKPPQLPLPRPPQLPSGGKQLNT